MFHKDKVGAEGGGVLLYVRKNLQPIEYSIDPEFEIIRIKLNTNNNLYVYFDL